MKSKALKTSENKALEINNDTEFYYFARPYPMRITYA